MREIFFDTRSIQFRQFWATLVFVAEKPPPPPRMRKKFLTPDLSISGNFEQLWFVEEKLPPPQMSEIFLIPDLSNSGNFEQLWFLWQKSPPPGWGKIFWAPDLSISGNFEQIFPHLWGVLFCHKNQSCLKLSEIIHFTNFWATLVFVAEKPPPTFSMREKLLTPDLSISGNFEKLWFVWQKNHPHPGWGKIFWHQIYPFQAILSNFGFCGRKAPLPPQDEGKFFDIRSIHFRQFWATFGFCGRKAPPPRMREIFLTPDLSISGNFEQLWFLWQKSSPPTHRWGKFFWHQIYPFQAILSNFWFLWQKSPPPQMREIFLTLDLSISGNFEQLWFLWQKSPSPLGWGKMFWHQIYPFQAISSNFGFCGRKAPLPPRMRENVLTSDLSISGKFWATLVFVAEKPPPHSQDEGKIFDIRSIHFRQFWATLVFVAEKPPPHSQDEGEFLTPDLSISGNFEQLWFCGRIVPPPPQNEGNIFDTRSIKFRQFWAI